LDPALIDSSFVSDRLEVDPAELQSLVEQMRDHGQQVPVLVRPHHHSDRRYQLAYGHRRVAAARLLERKVRAIVRAMTDEELVVSQGQENSSRTDLSYIERCLFAAKLEDGGFSRDIAMAAFSVDKTNVSRMIALARQIPVEMIHAIGAAPSVGRGRWTTLAEKLPAGNFLKEAADILKEEAVRALSSDERFDALLRRLTVRPDEITKNRRQWWSKRRPHTEFKYRFHP
jgi:ParB family chromosome partitioning protein